MNGHGSLIVEALNSDNGGSGIEMPSKTPTAAEGRNGAASLYRLPKMIGPCDDDWRACSMAIRRRYQILAKGETIREIFDRYARLPLASAADKSRHATLLAKWPGTDGGEPFGDFDDGG